MMEMVRERSRGGPSSSTYGIHNFSTLPCFDIKWGCRKHLVCVKDPSPERGSPSRFIRPELPHSDFRKRRSSSCDADDENINDADKCGIQVVREKLVLDLRNELSQMQASLFNGGKHSTVADTPADAPVGEVRPWNLRTRRAVCKDPNTTPITNNNTRVSDRKPSVSPGRNVKSPEKTDQGEEKRPRAKFAASLSKQEIEEDFMAMTGGRPARRPKKRNKYVQRQINYVFPGQWLSEISADMYKVDEQLPDGGKR